MLGTDDQDKKPDEQPGDKTGTPPTHGGDKTFTQADVDQIVRERLAREREKLSGEAEKTRKKLEADNLEKNQEWQKLAERRAGELADAQKRVGELEPVKATAARYETALKAHLDAQRAGLPEHIVALLDKLDPVEQLEYIAANRDKLVPNATTPATDKKPVPPTPKPGDPNQVTQDELDKRRKQLAATVRSYL